MKQFNDHLKTGFFLFVLFSVLITGCREKDSETEPDPDPEPEPTTKKYSLGWNGNDDLSKVPAVATFGYSSTNLPSSVNLVPKFPPIGDQGQYGTCVAWAVGYNVKTAINGIDKGFTTEQLKSPANQFSPKFLFMAIPDDQKGANCGGTMFATALDVLQKTGVATMQTVPYNLTNCSQSYVQSAWVNEAGKNKIKYWRKIDPDIQSIKKNLANNIPVVLGAKLSDNFMSWGSDNVLSSNTTYSDVGQHAYHAMVIAGYDDNKGPNGAFKIINSWGTEWGDRGYIWVDYNFMINEFCSGSGSQKNLYIAVNEGGTTPPDENKPATAGVDLAPWIFSDLTNYQTNGIPTERVINYNFYNIGNQTASPNDWSVLYFYYNAYNADDYGLLFYDKFNKLTPANTYDCPSDKECNFNYSINPGSNFAKAVLGSPSVKRTYNMPNITGYYYLVLVTDAGDNFEEQDEMNNYFYTTIEPKAFQNGYGYRLSDSSTVSKFQFRNDVSLENLQLKKSKFNTAVTPEFRNAYTPEEITSFLKEEKKNGNFNKKVIEYIQRKGKNNPFQ